MQKDKFSTPVTATRSYLPTSTSVKRDSLAAELERGTLRKSLEQKEGGVVHGTLLFSESEIRYTYVSRRSYFGAFHVAPVPSPSRHPYLSYFSYDYNFTTLQLIRIKTEIPLPLPCQIPNCPPPNGNNAPMRSIHRCPSRH